MNTTNPTSNRKRRAGESAKNFCLMDSRNATGELWGIRGGNFGGRDEGRRV